MHSCISEAWKPQLTFITTAQKKQPSRFRVNYNRVLVFGWNYPFKKPGHPVSYTYHKVGVLHETEDDPVEQGPAVPAWNFTEIHCPISQITRLLINLYLKNKRCQISIPVHCPVNGKNCSESLFLSEKVFAGVRHNIEIMSAIVF